MKTDVWQQSVNQQVMRLIVLLVLVVPQMLFIFMGINRMHVWRQADTASVARNFYKESPNIFKPRIDTRSDKTGITAMEFPLYQYVVSIVFRLFDSDREQWGIMVSLFASVLAFFALRRIFPYIDEKYLLFAYYSCPMVFAWSHKFMPEFFGLALSLWGFVFYHERKNFIFANILLLLGALVRPFFIFFFIPFVWDFMVKLATKRKICWKLLFMGLASLTIFSAWYFWWCPHLVEQYGINYFYMGSFSFANILLFLDYGFQRDIWSTVFVRYTGAILLIPFIIGIKKMWHDLKARQLFWVGIMTLTIIPMIVKQHFFIHPYYFLALSPLTIGFAAYELQFAKDWKRTTVVAAILFLIAYVVILLFFIKSITTLGMAIFLPVSIGLLFYIRSFYSKICRNHHLLEIIVLSVVSILVILLFWITKERVPRIDIISKSDIIVPLVKEKTQESDLFVTNDPGHSVVFWKVKRKGFLVPNKILKKLAMGDGELLNRYLDKGVKWALYWQEGAGFKLFGLSPDGLTEVSF